MVDYKIVKQGNVFNVVEQATDHIVFTSVDEKDAKLFARKWNLGEGFSGWTPAFFLEKSIFSSDYKFESD